ncbi:ABC-2 type transporter-domain-containing protein [Fomes fomentarius]|nr:ABC-2 type transporter-domain-containing protein [Fomes fomentarius]
MAARSAGKRRVDLVSIHIPTTGGSLEDISGSVADDLGHGGQELPPDSLGAYVSTDEVSFAPAQQIDIVKAAAAFETLSITLAQQSVLEGEEKGLPPGKSESTVGGLTRSWSEKDLEKGSEPQARFNLREYLTSSNDTYQSAGIKHKHVGVTWENLQVDVAGGVGQKAFVRTFGQDAIEFWTFPYNFLMSWIRIVVPAKNVPTTTILHQQSGLLKPGEMCLVLGCPGAGCTTFLKTMANQRGDYAQVSGDVRYAGIDAAEMAKYYKGEVAYNQEDDIHIPTLTVSQTLSFALSLKTPGPNGRLPGISRKEFDKTVQDTLLRMLNISHTANTYVGDEFVRGVSGGERKRVSIAEMMATRAHVLSYDNSTRGLDASTALNFVKALRVMTDVLGQTTFVSLYQAGEGIYDLFDKVLVLNKGRQVYFGPPSEARAYFESLGYRSLPRQSTPDYLTGCTDPNERQFARGRSAADVPSTPADLEEAFLKSAFAQGTYADLTQYKKAMDIDKADQQAFREAVAADKKRGVSRKSPYTLGFTGQVRALAVRQFQMRLQDKFQLMTSFTLSIIIAFLIGGAFFNLQPNALGTFTRGSVIFLTLLNSSIDNMGEIPAMMLGRPILKKQTDYSLYRPAAIPIANTLADLPFSAVRIFIYNIIIYFMSNLNRSAGAFWTFHLFTYVTFVAVQGFFRTIGLLCSNFDNAFRLATFFMPNMIQYAGYMIPVFDMQRWLFWIYYINPISYAWAGLMENEFMRITISCDGNYVVPRNPPGLSKYPDVLGINQACTLFGSSPGSSVIPGSAYLQAGYGLDVADLWRRNFLVILGYLIVFQLAQVLVIELFPQHGGGSGTIVYAKENSDTKTRNAVLKERKILRKQMGEKGVEVESSSEEMSSNSFKDGKSFTWEKINYHVPVSGGTRTLLHDIYGYVKPGSMTALMGASGAGKTTCLDVLAQRKNIGVVAGNMLLDGRPLQRDFARRTAYAEQMDVHEPTATVREAMRFSAYLRQPPEVSKEGKDAYVEEMIEVLELQELADAIIGSLGVADRKRVTIGVELASKPSLLFLDEPTSGLDGQSAWNLVRFLRKLADNGQAILCTIHQPSSLLFQAFDKLLLLERGGESVYFGDIGVDSHVLRDYFARHGAHCPSNVNPAEYMLDAIGAGLAPRKGDRDWKDVWLDSSERAMVLKEIENIKREAAANPSTEKNNTTYATSFFHQLKVVIGRNNLTLWRCPDLVFSRLFVHGFISLFISLSFLQLGHSVRDLQYRVFGIFWATILPSLVMGQIEPGWIMNRRIFIREASSRMYSPYVFAIAQIISDIPYGIIGAILYWVLMVYPMGFGQGSAAVGGTFFQLLCIYFVELFGVSFGQFIATISPSMQIAPLFNPWSLLILGTFCGVTLPFQNMAKFFQSWLYYLDPYTRLLSSMLSTELHGLSITCRDAEFALFQPPAGQTCQTWATEFIAGFGGYLDNPDDTAVCRYCQYAVGDDYLRPLNIAYSNRWRDAFILLAFCVFNCIVTIVASRLLRFAKR